MVEEDSSNGLAGHTQLWARTRGHPSGGGSSKRKSAPGGHWVNTGGRAGPHGLWAGTRHHRQDAAPAVTHTEGCMRLRVARPVLSQVFLLLLSRPGFPLGRYCSGNPAAEHNSHPLLSRSPSPSSSRPLAAGEGASDLVSHNSAGTTQVAGVERSTRTQERAKGAAPNDNTRSAVRKSRPRRGGCQAEQARFSPTPRGQTGFTGHPHPDRFRLRCFTVRIGCT